MANLPSAHAPVSFTTGSAPVPSPLASLNLSAPPPPCASCQGVRANPAPAPSPGRRPPPRPWQLFTPNAVHEGTYEAYSVAVPGGVATYTHVNDYATGESFNYVSTAGGAQNPGAGVSAGTWASNGTADDYWMGAGSSVSRGPTEYGFNDNGYNMGIAASTNPTRWNPFGTSAVVTNTVHASDYIAPVQVSTPTVTMPAYDLMGMPTGFTQEVPNPNYRPVK